MIKVFVPNNFLPERKYITETLLWDLIGVECTIETDEALKDYILELPNGNRLIIQDSFFSNLNEVDGYMNVSSLTSNVSFIKNDFIPENDIPVLYGNDFIELDENKITCGIDVFASSFFMLTRWEECVLDDRDAHNRFPAGSSLAYKCGILNRPVVNEYAEMLWNMMLKLGLDEKMRRTRTYKIIPTHDVDKVYFNYQFEKIIGDAIIELKPLNAFKRIYYDLRKDNKYDTFDWLMDINEKNGLQGRFYFLSDGTCKEDSGFSVEDDFILKLVKKIKTRGHLTGFHPGYATYNNSEEWNRQKNVLEEAFNMPVDEGRQHFLRLSMPDTLQIWENNEMRLDSTLGYSSQAGFRCGTADEFRFFNVLTRTKMNLLERPLIFMDETFRVRGKLEQSLNNAKNAMVHYKEVCKKYNMPLTILFHNGNFEPLRWKGWKEFYENDVIG